MKKFIAVLKKEYSEIVKKKSFLISTLLTPLLMAAFFYIPVLMFKVGKGEKLIYVADYSKTIFQELIRDATPQSGEVYVLKGVSGGTLRIRQIRQPDPDREKLQQEYQKRILNKEFDALVIIPPDIETLRFFSFYSTNVSDFDTLRLLEKKINQIVSRQILEKENVSADVIKSAFKEIDILTFKVKKEGTQIASSGFEYYLSIFMLSILFSVIMGYGQLISRNILEEKNSRIIEVLISSINPKQLFFGKTLGIGFAGLTQVLIWIALAGLLVTKFSNPMVAGLKMILNIELAVYFIIFFVLGYFMYATIFAIIGASVNTDQEAQQFSAPIIYLLMIPFFLGIMVTQNPNSPITVYSSLFPLFSPLLMFMRITIAPPPFWQIGLSILLSALTIVLFIILGSKIFRTGILMYGKKPTLKEIFTWLKAR